MISQKLIDGLADLERRASRKINPNRLELIKISTLIELKKTPIKDLEEYFDYKIPFWILIARNQMFEIAPIGSAKHPSRMPAKASPSWAAILGVSPDSSKEKIKLAYWEKAKKAHPDAGGDHERFLLIEGAYREALDSLT